ncbi:hypothetical protein IAT40_005071 [Kwoniella sp. CBS 6097]
MAGEDPKKKRKQNVACDSCKLRRIKCDLSELLFALPSSSSSPDLSLGDLALQHPDIGCTNCKNKRLKCTTEGIIKPTKPNKGGKRIEEAKKKFGQEQEMQQQRESISSSGTSNVEADDSQLDHGQISAIASTYDIATHPTLETPQVSILPPDVDGIAVPRDADVTDAFFPQIPDHASSDKPPDFTEQDMFKFLFPDFPPQQPIHAHQTDANSTFLPHHFDANAPQPTQAVTPLLYSQTPNHSSVLPYPAPITTDTSNFDRAWSIWQEFASNPKAALEHVRATGQTPGAERTPLSIIQGTPLDTVIDQITNIRREAPGNLLGGQLDTPAQRLVPSSPAYTPLSDLSSEYLPHDQSLQHSRKRSRSSTPSFGEVGRAEKMILLTDDPWQLYMRDRDRDVVHWGRREAVQERLADKALGMALSAHLVKVFFQAVHLSYPAISPETFYLDWARAGQRSDRMRPAQEVLCAVIEAWGARYSDCPVILGLDPQKADHAPKVIQKDGTFIPGTRARTHWGRARLSACKALMDRARRLIDDHSLLRIPSVTGVQALTLYSQLSHMTDQKVVDQDHWLQARMIHSTIIEQMSLLGLMWDPDTPIVTDHSEAQLTTPQIQIRQRRLFWTHMIGDAFFSASIGQLPKMSQEDVDFAGEWIDTVHEKLPQSSFKLLSFFIIMYHRLGIAAREMAIKIAYPLRKKGSGDIPKICGIIRKLWKEILDIENTINEDVYELLRACNRNELLGFSPLNYLSNLRLSAPFLLLILHQLIREQLDFWKNVSCAYIATPSDDSTPSSTGSAHTGSREKNGGSRNVELLDRLSKESVDGLLRSCRAQIGMIESIIPTGIIQSASILLRALMATVQLLAEVPTNEQGYPSWTPGGKGWTWEAKQREVNCCCEALHQLGWAWADVGDVLDAVMLTMERLTPSPDELQQWKLKQERGQAPTQAEVSHMYKENQAENDKLMSAVLQFWPPVSIPHLIESAMQKGPQWVKEGSIDQITEHISASLRESPLGGANPASGNHVQPWLSPAATTHSDRTSGASLGHTANHSTTWTDTLAQPPPPQAALTPLTRGWLDALTSMSGTHMQTEGEPAATPSLFALTTEDAAGDSIASNSAPYPHMINDKHFPSSERVTSTLNQNTAYDSTVLDHLASVNHDLLSGIASNNETFTMADLPNQDSASQQELQKFLDRLCDDQAIAVNQDFTVTQSSSSHAETTQQPGKDYHYNGGNLASTQAQNAAAQVGATNEDRHGTNEREMGDVPSLSSDAWKGLDAIYGGSRNV